MPLPGAEVGHDDTVVQQDNSDDNRSATRAVMPVVRVQVALSVDPPTGGREPALPSLAPPRRTP